MKKSLFRIPGSYKLLLYIFLCLNFLPCKIYGQEVSSTQLHTADYAQIFGHKYTNAVTFLYQNHWIWDSLKMHQVDPAFAIAIVFPEIMRYSEIKDKIEKGGLFSLYIYYGEKYANFSVGEFQMKPSFARQLEEDLAKLPKRKARQYPAINTADIQNARKERVKRLDDLQWQVRYLALFMRIMDQRYKNTQWTSNAEKLKFYATAYNFGYTKSYTAIYEAINKKNFHLGWTAIGERYCYADISLNYAHNALKDNY
jgi:hypothetical protein